MNLNLKKEISKLVLFVMILNPVKEAAAAEMIMTAEFQQAEITANEVQPIAPSELPSGSLFAGDSAISPVHSGSSSITVVDQEGNQIGGMVYDMPQLEPIQEIPLNEGTVLNHQISDKTGYIIDGPVTTNYKDVTILSSAVPALETFTKHAAFPSTETTVLNLIGTYTAGGETFAVYGQVENEVYQLNDGKLLTFNPADKTGFIKDGDVTERYESIRMLGTYGCNAEGDCWAADFALLEGETTLGGFSKQAGAFNVRYAVVGRKTGTEIAMRNGLTLHFNNDRTGFVQNGSVTTNYEDVTLLSVGSPAPETFTKPAGPLSEETITLSLVGTYSTNGEKMGVYALVKNEIYQLGNGKTLTFNPADKTGVIRKGVVTEHYEDIDMTGIRGCNAEGVCWAAGIALEEGEEEIGSFSKQSGDYNVLFLVAGKKVKTEIFMNNGLLIQINPDKTGFVKEGSVKDHYESIGTTLSHTTVCDGNGNCETLAVAVHLEEGFVSIGSYEVIAGNTTSLYMIYGKEDTREITLENGKLLTIDLQKRVIPVTPVVRALESALSAKASLFRGGSVSAYSSTSFSKSDDREEEKKKKKRKLRRII